MAHNISHQINHGHILQRWQLTPWQTIYYVIIFTSLRTHERDDEHRLLLGTRVAHMAPTFQMVRGEAHKTVIVGVHHQVSAEEHELDEEPLPGPRPAVRPNVWDDVLVEAQALPGATSRVRVPQCWVFRMVRGYGSGRESRVERSRETQDKEIVKLLPDLGKVYRAPRTRHLVEIYLRRIAHVCSAEHLPRVPRLSTLGSQLNVSRLVQADAKYSTRQL